MARPEKHNADYFSHDKDMRNDPKVKALRKKFKDGYAVWNMLLELLTATDFFVLELTPLNYELMAGDFDVEAEILEQIISYCVKIELLKSEENKIYSCGLKKRLQPVIDNRNAVKQRFLDKKLNTSKETKEQNTQSKVKYSKVKESKDIVVEEVAAEAEIFEEKIEESNLEKKEYFFENENAAVEPEIIEETEKKLIPVAFEIDEEEYSAAEAYLKTQSRVYNTLQSQQSISANECLKLFRNFYEQKMALEQAYKTPKEMLDNFFFWVPKHLVSNRPKSIPQNGTANINPRTSAKSTPTHVTNREDRNQLVNSLKSLLLGTEPK